MKVAGLAVLAAALGGCSTPQVMNVTPIGGATGAPCVAEVDGRRIAADAFPAFARQWRGREAHLTADMHTPYRCFGFILFELQRAGFRKIDFISEPPPSASPPR